MGVGEMLGGWLLSAYCLYAFFFHEKKNVVASVLVKGDKQPLKLRHLFFRDNQHSSTLRNQVVIRKNHGSTFVAVGENLGLHAVKA